MIFEMYKTARQKSAVEDYIKANLGGIIHAVIHNKAELKNLSSTDEIVVANAKCLARNVSSLIHVLSLLSSHGIRVYFAEENVCLHGSSKAAEILHILDTVSSRFKGAHQ